MKCLLFALRMIFIGPLLILDGFHKRQDFTENYQRLKHWVDILLKSLKAAVVLERSDLIPLEDGYVFVCGREGEFDPLILVSALPVRVNFVLEPKERVPVLNAWMKRIGTYRKGVSGLCDPAEFKILEETLKQSDNLVFFLNTPMSDAKGSDILAYAYAMRKTLIPVRIEGGSKLLSHLGQTTVQVTIGLPLHYEEYGEDLKEKTLAEITDRIRS